MAFSNATETALAALIFQAIAWAGIADNAAATPLTQIATALHTADPAGAGTQATSETTYAGYARQNVTRSAVGFTVTGNPTTIVPAAAITFPASTGGTGTITNFSYGKTGGGATAIIIAGSVNPNISVVTPAQPILSTASTVTIT